MIFIVKVPALGEVNVLTADDDIFEVISGQPDGTTYYEIPAGTIILLKSNRIYGTYISYISDIKNYVNTIDIVDQLLQAKVVTYQAKFKNNIFRPFYPS